MCVILGAGLLKSSQLTVEDLSIFCKWFNEIALDNNKIKAGKAGAIPVLLNALNMHITDSDMSINGCYAIMSITMDNGNYPLSRVK